LKITTILLTVLAAAAALHAPLSAGDMTDPELMERARALHESAIVIDTHVDTPLLMTGRGLEIGERSDIGEVDLVRMAEGGLDAVFLAVFVSNELDDGCPAKVALETMDTIHRQLAANGGIAGLALSAADIRRLEAEGRRAVLIGMENGGPVQGSLGLLRDYYRLGARYITLTHNGSNHICDSSTDQPRWGGLSPFGVEMVAEMNRLGMIVDVSHISDEAFRDVIEHSRAPVIASHSASRAVCDVPRNLSDPMLEALAENGGVVQVVFYSGFISKRYADQSEKVREELRPVFEKIREETGDNRDEYYSRAMPIWKERSPEAPDIGVLIDHIDHIVDVAGIDHVGLGSDFDGAGSFPKGLEDVTGYPLITYHLLERGYSEEDARKILGGNFLRVFEEVERAAGR